MSNSERHTFAARSRIGSYEVIRPLARGGMAELFLVRSVGPEGFEKIVVLKRVLPHLAANQRFVRAFLDEAKLVAGLEHPNIAPVYDMGTIDGSYYFTMEYVRGVDVRAILKRCKRDAAHLPLEHAVMIARDIAAALHYAHERRNADGNPLSLVHRDVSPSNIIVSFEGAPKLIDFGIAKATSSSAKTQTGSLKGKVSYMSPEQARGAAIDRRSDVFALGIVLWEALAGARLFKSDNDLATLQRIIYEPAPPLGDARVDCPAALVQIVARALAIDPRNRFQTAQELQLELEELAHEHKLKLSTFALGAYLRDRFAGELGEADDVAGATSTGITAPAPDADPDHDADDLEAFTRPVAQPVPVSQHAHRARWPWLVAIGACAAAAISISIAMHDRTSTVDAHRAAHAPLPAPSRPAVTTPPTPQPLPQPTLRAEPQPAPRVETHGGEPIVRAASPARAKRPPKGKQPPAAKTVDPVSPEPAIKPSVPFDPNSVFPP